MPPPQRIVAVPSSEALQLQGGVAQSLNPRAYWQLWSQSFDPSDAAAIRLCDDRGIQQPLEHVPQAACCSIPFMADCAEALWSHWVGSALANSSSLRPKCARQPASMRQSHRKRARQDRPSSPPWSRRPYRGKRATSRSRPRKRDRVVPPLEPLRRAGCRRAQHDALADVSRRVHAPRDSTTRSLRYWRRAE